MKRILYLSGTFLGLSVLFGVCYYFSFRNALLHYNQKAVEQNTELLQQLLEYSGKREQLLYEIIAQEQTDADLSAEVLQIKEVISADADYYLETKYLVQGTMTKEQTSLPGFMVGISREELIAYMKGYMECMPINEYLAGLVQYEIVSFSPERIVLRKTYHETKVENQFFLCMYNGYVTVYYSDLKTVYEYTDIECASLPTTLQERIRQGFYVKDAKELYSILEGYSS